MLTHLPYFCSLWCILDRTSHVRLHEKVGRFKKWSEVREDVRNIHHRLPVKSFGQVHKIENVTKAIKSRGDIYK